MNDGMKNIKELIERYLKGLSTEDLCDDSEDLIEFIEMVRDNELIRRMEQAGEILTPASFDGSDEDDEIIE